MVSVIIPVYNTEAYVGRCIESVLEQTYTDLEIIIVDDGSTDNSLTICQDYSRKDPYHRIIVISQENQGASTARNKGIDVSSGEYLMFVDSDDWIDKTMVESLHQEMTLDPTDLIISQIGDYKPYQSATNVNSDEALTHVIRDRIWWGPCGKLFRREVFSDIRFPKYTLSEDYFLMSHILLKGVTVRYIPLSFYHRNIRAGSLSRMALCERSFDELENVLSVYESVHQQKPSLEKYAERNLVETIIKLSFSLHKNGLKSKFPVQCKRIRSLVRKYLFSVLFNKCIPFKYKLLFAKGL